MWIVTLKAPTTVNGELRNPIEGSILVSEAEAERLFDNDLLTEEPSPAPEPDSGRAENDGADAGLEDLSVPDLHILVTKEGVPLHGVTKKADIIKAILKHREDKAEA